MSLFVPPDLLHTFSALFSAPETERYSSYPTVSMSSHCQLALVSGRHQEQEGRRPGFSFLWFPLWEVILGWPCPSAKGTSQRGLLCTTIPPLLPLRYRWWKLHRGQTHVLPYSWGSPQPYPHFCNLFFLINPQSVLFWMSSVFWVEPDWYSPFPHLFLI